MPFPVALNEYRPVSLNPDDAAIPADIRPLLERNITIVRDAIVFMTALSNRKGVGGHTGGAYDLVPEAMLMEGFINGGAPLYPVHFDDAGHRVAIQYVLSVLHGKLDADTLLRYREYDSGLPGHPESDITPGIMFNSGRLGHLWSHVNGLSIAHPEKTFFIYSSDGAQQEGNNAEAARFAAANGLNVKVLIDDNNITISGSPSDYLPGFDLGKTLSGLGIPADTGNGEDLDTLYARIRQALLTPGPRALINKRPIAPGIPIVEGTPHAHDAVSFDAALAYFKGKNDKAAAMLEAQGNTVSRTHHAGCGDEWGYSRKEFGNAASRMIASIPADARKSRVLAVDSDLAGSCGLNVIQKDHPELFITGGITERNNFSTAAGFGSREGAQGIFGTFAAFQEMLLSEITMARLNEANVLAHFSHSGVDDMSDNTCHFGINNLFADNGLPENDNTLLCFPADIHQMAAAVEYLFDRPGLRFLYSTRSPVPAILSEDGSPKYGNSSYRYKTEDDIVRKGTDGWVVSYGDILYRCLDAVERLRERGVNLGLINKHCLNRPDDAILQKLGGAPFVAVFESQNRNTGLGSRIGSWMLERGHCAPLHTYGTCRPGNCGMGEQVSHQKLDASGILETLEGIISASRS